MYNELGYIDVEPFKINECNSKDTMIINEKENHLELKVHNTGKFDCFEVLAGGLGKTTKSKIYYGLNSKNNPITFFDSNISESNYSSINSSTIISNIYAIGIRDNCKHLTYKTKLKNFNYYNDKLNYYYFDNFVFQKNSTDLQIEIKKMKPLKLATLDYKNNKLTIYLMNYFQECKKLSKISINHSSYFKIEFDKEVNILDVFDIVSKVDATLHMCVLHKTPSYTFTVYDISKKGYIFNNYKNKKYKNEKMLNFNICKNEEEKNKIFINLLDLFININEDNKNVYLPFVNFYKNMEYQEIEFLEYYKVIEVIDNEKNLGIKCKEPLLKKYLEKYSKLKKYFFENESIDDLSNEIRSLRNYYSHIGFYIKDLPVPTKNPKRYKKINSQWLYDVKRLVKIIAYNEMYEKANIKINELELINYLY